MISQGELFDRVKAVYPDVQWVPAFPYVYGEVVSGSFDPDPDLREEQIAAALKLTPTELRDTTSRLFVRIDARRPDEPSSLPTAQAAFWLGSMLGSADIAVAAPPANVRIVHFYGFKGGQGRSTTLALLSRALASEGWRVLVLDLDAEAPSLDLLLNQRIERPEHTLVGVRGGLAPRPLRALPGDFGGFVDLLAFSPAGEEFAGDAASLAMEMALYPPGQAALAARLSGLLANYDVVLLDHRTGLAPTVLPWVTALPGALGLFARMDGQWLHAVPAVRSLWQHAVAPFGALIALAPPGEEREKHQVDHREDAAYLLRGLALLLSDGDHQVDEHDLVGERFVVLPFDNQVVGGKVPPPSELGGATTEALGALRLACYLHGPPPRADEPAGPSLAGDRGGGLGLETEALQTLMAENEIDWIVGRKGTGKTWLLRALHERGRGQALLVPQTDDESFPAGLPVREPKVERITLDPTRARNFWWALIAAGLEHDTNDRDELLDAYDAALKLPDPSLRVEDLAQAHQGPPKLLLIDGLELAFPPENTVKFIDALIRVVHGIRSTARLRNAVRVQVFIRTDLFDQPYENFEQLSQGRRLDLTWDHRSALNLLLATVLATSWYSQRFPEAVSQLKEKDQQLRSASVPVGVCEDGLELVFSERAGVTNLLTRSFWRTYFTDDPSGASGYYPRLLRSFVEMVPQVVNAAPGEDGLERKRRRDRIEQVRVASWVLAQAHAEVTQGKFLLSVQSELKWLLPDRLRGQALAQVIEALNGETTPFGRVRLVNAIAKGADLPSADVGLIFERMRTLGIFEVTESDAREWRATRLYRTALRMKFRRQ